MAEKKPPRDPNQLAKYILDAATGEGERLDPPVKDQHFKALSQLGASKGGQARKQSLTSERRSEIAKQAAQKRWNKGGGD